MATEEFERWKADEAAAYLSRVKGAQARVKSLADEMVDIYEEIAGLKAIDYTKDRVDGGAISYLLEQMLDDKDQRLHDCQRQAHDLECLLRRVTYILDKMDDQFHASILERHYVNGIGWRTVAIDAGYAEASIFDIRIIALNGFYDCMFAQDSEIPDALESS